MAAGYSEQHKIINDVLLGVTYIFTADTIYSNMFVIVSHDVLQFVF